MQQKLLGSIALLRGGEEQAFAGPAVEGRRNGIAVDLGQMAQALALGQILPDKAVGVFAGAA